MMSGTKGATLIFLRQKGATGSVAAFSGRANDFPGKRLL